MPRARTRIQVASAASAKSPAVGTAGGHHRQAEQDQVPDDRFEVDDLADDILRTRTRLQGIVDDVNGDLGSGRLRLTAAQRRAGPQAAHYGQRLHAEVAERVSHDPFLRSRLTYNIKGVDFRYNMAKNVRFEVTTPGQISSHTNRFITQGISGYVWFITYTR